MQYQLRNLTPDDIPAIMNLQHAYERIYNGAIIVPGEIYLSPAMNNGENVICAFGDDGSMKGYTVVSVNIAMEPDVPHIIWSIVKVDPDLASRRLLQDALFDTAVTRALELVKPHPGHEIRLNFQHRGNETDIIEYLFSKGCDHIESVFNMVYDLSRETDNFECPSGIVVRDLNIDDEAELRTYIAARNGYFPQRAVTLQKWLDYYRMMVKHQGKVINAYDERQLAGSVLAYQDPTPNGYDGFVPGVIEDVFVRDAWRNRGIAGHLIQTAWRYFTENGCTHAVLEVRATNERALHLYEKLGYETVAESRFYSITLRE